MEQLIIGTASCPSATKVLLLGAGELGKEVAIECQRLGIEVIACDRYPFAPAMHIAHRSHVFDMLDGEKLQEIILLEQPDFIVPEIEAIATATLVKLEQQGHKVVPSAHAVSLTMNREGIRSLAAIELGVPTSPFCFADTEQEFRAAVQQIGLPCVVKPIMSSSGKGQSVLRDSQDLSAAWHYAEEGGRAGKGRVIVEGFVDFDYEITLLTLHASDGIHFCAPIGHHQQDGDYRQSWQPQMMSETALEKAQQIAAKVVQALGGYGLFGVEFFVKGDQVYFNEVSPRPHDTGMVTLISQSLSEFALHVRAFLGLPIGNIPLLAPSASAVILTEGQSQNLRYRNLAAALSIENTQLRLFAKPELAGKRRLGVALASAPSLEEAMTKAINCAECVEVIA